MTFLIVVGIAAYFAAAIASVAGFGIGAVLTPILALALGMKTAVAVTAIPHALASSYRLWILRAQVDRRLLLNFGLSSIAGSLCGAGIHAAASNNALSILLGVLLILAGAGGLTGFTESFRLGRKASWIAGFTSGALGGLVGNQGGIRSAAMLAFEVPKESFVATATAIGLLVDAARLPIYIFVSRVDYSQAWSVITVCCLAVIVGTLTGATVLRRIPEHLFRKVVSAIILMSGVLMLIKGNS
jgi:uncharacterized membrane protein YfcA